MLVVALAAAAALLAPNSSLFSDSSPPERYRGDATVTLRFADQHRIEETCQPRFGTPPAGMKTDACALGGGRIVAPNPCAYPRTDRYAYILCHELGHVNGWPSTHGD